MNKLKKILSSSIIFITLFFVSINPALGGTPPPFDPTGGKLSENINLGDQDVIIVVLTLIGYALTFLGILSLILIIYAGFLWMTAAGEEEKIKKAQDILKGALIGLIIVMSSYAISRYVFDLLVTITSAG